MYARTHYQSNYLLVVKATKNCTAPSATITFVFSLLVRYLLLVITWHITWHITWVHRGSHHWKGQGAGDGDLLDIVLGDGGLGAFVIRIGACTGKDVDGHATPHPLVGHSMSTWLLHLFA